MTSSEFLLPDNANMLQGIADLKRKSSTKSEPLKQIKRVQGIPSNDTKLGV
jgi:hypothetical protein